MRSLSLSLFEVEKYVEVGRAWYRRRRRCARCSCGGAQLGPGGGRHVAKAGA